MRLLGYDIQGKIFGKARHFKKQSASRNFYFKERNAPRKCYLRFTYLVTGIVGIQTTEINGIRDTLAKH